MWRLGSLLLLALLTGCGATRREVTPADNADPVLDYPVGPFALTERSGRTVTDRDLHGTVWIASFVFTRCTGPCPAVSATVARLQTELKDYPGVKLVTFTVDPKHDDLTKLREYARSRNADPERWLFLTGDEATIHAILRDQFKQAVARNDDPAAGPGDAFEHSTRLVLVDKNGVIRGTYPGLPDDRQPDGDRAFETDLNRLKKRALELLQE